MKGNTKQTIPEQVSEYVKKNAKARSLRIVEANQIIELGNMFDIVTTAFAYGYMKGCKSRKGGAV